MAMTTPDIILTVSAVIAAAIAAYIYASVQAEKKARYMLDALEDNESNFRFRKGRTQRSFNNTLNRMHDLYEKYMHELGEQERYYSMILDNVTTGILVFDAESGQTVYANRSALSLLGVLSLYNIRQLRGISGELASVFDTLPDGKQAEISYETDFEARTVTVTCSDADISNKKVRIIAFNDISGNIEENETQSWTKLVRVLTHEIMNTVSPVVALSEALSIDIAGGELGSDELRTGLETITNSSKSLIRFVESYRDLAKIPRPLRKTFYIRDMVNKVIDSTRPFAEENGAVVKYTGLSEDIILYADEEQISRILVNLVRNAVQAGAANVDISAEIGSLESVNIFVSNDGAAINPESKDQIFVPFYSTKQDGSGIGLSVSRQIMRQHGGTLRLVRSESKNTVFVLSFK